MDKELIDRVTEIVDRAGVPQGIEAVEVKWVGSGPSRLLRIYIDKPEGVTHGDCELISDVVGQTLDAENVIPGEGYTLEVSSPGVERKLLRPRDYERFLGKKVKVVLREPVADRKLWEGTLAAFRDGLVTIEPSGGNPVQFRLDQVQRANLKFEW